MLSTSLEIGDIHKEMTVLTHGISKLMLTSAGREAEEQGLSAGWRERGQTFAYPTIQHISPLGLSLEKLFHLYMSYKNVHCGTVYNSQKLNSREISAVRNMDKCAITYSFLCVF